MPEKKIDYLPEGDEKHLQFIDKQYREHPVVKQHHGKWKELIAWGERGEQFSEWNEDEKMVKPITLQVRKELIVVNLMKPLGEAIDSKINMTHQIEGSPGSSELEDMQAAEVGTKINSYVDLVNDIESILQDMKYDLRTTGNAFIKILYEKGKEAWLKPDKEDGKPRKIDEEITISNPSVFNIRPDPTAKKRSQMRWIIEFDEVTEQEIERNFKLTEEDKKAIANAEGGSGVAKYAGMNEPELEKDKEENTHIMAWYWEKKSPDFPEGRHIISIPGKVLFKDKNANGLGEIPLWHFGYKKSGNSLWHTGPYHHVQGIQRAINREIGITAEHLNGWRAKMVLSQGANLKQGAFTTDSFEILEVDTTKGDIKPLDTPELSPQHNIFRDFLIGAMNTVSNVHEVSYSQLPKYASRAPASLFAMLLEQENIKIDPMLTLINKNLVEMARFKLRLADKFYDTPRMIKILGKNKVASIDYFKGADLKGNFDVKLAVGVSIFQSKAILQSMLLSLRREGVLKPEDDAKIIKLLNLGDIERELQADLADEVRAIRENQAFTNGSYKNSREKGGVYLWLHDNDQVHLDYHLPLGKSEEAQRWDLQTWNDFNTHCFEHFKKIVALKQIAAQRPTTQGLAENAVPPAPGAEGEPTGPVAPGEMPSPAVKAETSNLPF